MTAGNIKGALLALLSMGLYSTHDVIIKLLGETYPALQILFFSALLSFPPIAVLLLRDRTHGTLRPRNPFWVGLRSACIVISGVCGFYAFSALPLAQVYAILFATPLLITLLSIPILGERVGIHRWLAVLLGLCGVLIVLRPGGGDALSLGHLAALLAALSSATAAVVTRRLGGGERPLVLLMWPMLGNLVMTGAGLTLHYVPMELSHLAMAGMIAVLGLTGGFLSILAYRAGEAAIVAFGTIKQKPWVVDGEVRDMRDQVVANYEKDGLSGLVLLGGGGTAKNAMRLAQAGLNVITLPKTIDNDIAHTDTSFGLLARQASKAVAAICPASFTAISSNCQP